MRRFPLLSAALAVFLLAGCNRDSATEVSQEMAQMDVYDSAPTSVAMPTARGLGREEAKGEGYVSQEEAGAADASAASLNVAPDMIIRTGSARVRVDSLERAVAAVRALAVEVGGFVANAEILSGHAENRRASLQIRIPAPAFDRLVGGLAPVGRVESVNVTAQDVGEEYTDVTARLENARRLEERLQGILQARTGTLADVLAVERELARIRGEAERLEGRLRYLRARTSVSEFTVHLFEPGPLVGDRPGANPLVLAVQRSVRNFVGVIVFLIEAAGVAIPVGLLVLGGWWILRRFRPARSRGEPTPFGPVVRREPAGRSADDSDAAD
jgi:hypothetical protein